MRVLMLSRSSANLSAASPTADRWRLLRDRGIVLTVILASSDTQSGWQEPGLHVYASGGSNPFARFYRMYKRGKTCVQEVDLITSEDPLELGCVAWLLSRAGNKPFELQDHAGTFEDVNTYEPFWHIRRWIARWLLPRARVIRTVNPQSFKRLQSVYHHDAYWLPIAPDQRFLDVSHGSIEDVIVCVARLVPVKRIDILLQAFTFFRQTHPSARLCIVGEGPLKSALMQEASALGLSEAVAFIGNADPLPVLATARVFALLSAHEGWGVAALEAAAVGVPIVMTPTGCGPWLAEEGNALLAEEMDPQAVADKLNMAWDMSVQPLRSIKTRAQTADAQVAAWNIYGTSL